MATFFGEIVLPSSRVFFDDSDEEDDTESDAQVSPFELKENISGSVAEECDLLIISEGNVASGFCDYHLTGGNSAPVAEIKMSVDQDKINSISLCSRDVGPTMLYKLNSKTKLLDVSSSINMLLCNNLTTLIEPALINAKKILVLCSRATAEYRCDSVNDLPTAFLRVLKSSSWSDPVVHRTVEQPNFISGLPASIVSWCEASNKPCIAAICFTDINKPESVTVAPFINFFNSSAFANICRPSQGQVVYKSRTKLSQVDSNMYL